MRRAVSAIGIGLALTLLAVSPAEAGIFKKKPVNNNRNNPARPTEQVGNKAYDAIYASRRQAISNFKAIQKRGAPQLRAANRALAASARAEFAARRQLANARTQFENAKLNDAAETSTDSKRNRTRAEAQLQPLEASYNQLLTKMQADRTRATQLRTYQRQATTAIGVLSTLKPRAARVGRPNAAAAPRIAVNRVVFDGAGVVNRAGAPPAGAKAPRARAVQNIKSIYGPAPNLGAAGPRAGAAPVVVQNGYIAVGAPAEW